jgi:hypothetical protein
MTQEKAHPRQEFVLKQLSRSSRSQAYVPPNLGARHRGSDGSVWSQLSEARSLPVVHIGIVWDGPSDIVPEIRQIIRKQIHELTSQEFDMRFPSEFELDGGWSVTGVNQAIDRLLDGETRTHEHDVLTLLPLRA